jgi:hypothetical protein
MQKNRATCDAQLPGVGGEQFFNRLSNLWIFQSEIRTLPKKLAGVVEYDLFDQ